MMCENKENDEDLKNWQHFSAASRKTNKVTKRKIKWTIDALVEKKKIAAFQPVRNR